jgi:hypothetical protein
VQSTLRYTEQHPPTEILRDARWLWLSALPVAVVSTALTFAARPGINWLASCVGAMTAWLLCAGAADAAGFRARIAEPPCVTALGLATLLAGSGAVTAEPLLNALAVLFILLLAGFVVRLITRADADRESPAALLLSPLTSATQVAAEAARRASEALLLLRAGPRTPVLRGGALALPVLAVLFLLLSASDPTLDAWRAAALELVKRFIAPARLTYFALWLAAMLGATGLALQPAERSERSDHARERDGTRPVLVVLERLIVLGSIIVLFALYFGLRLSEIFGNVGARTDSGVTFAEATHHGFVELTIAATLCAGVIIGLDRLAARGGHETRVRAFADIVIAQALLLLGSAYHRVALYEAAYGYTAERLGVQIYCWIVGVGLVLLAIELHRGISIARLLRRCALAVIGTFLAISYSNPTSWIVEQNIARHRATGKIDAQYLAHLAGSGCDAVPELIRALPELRVEEAAALHAALVNTSRSLGDSERWYEWNLRRARARSALRSAGIE